MNRVRRFLASACAAAIVSALSGAWACADDRPLARAVIMPELIPAVAQQLVPMTVELPAGRSSPRAQRIKIVGLVYCGSDGRTGAWALGVAYPDIAAPESNILSTADCQAPLPETAARLAHKADAPDWVEVIKARVTWTPWMLRFAVADAAGGAKGAGGAPSLKQLGDLKSFPTSNLRILPPPGQENRFDVAIAFLESSIVVAAFPAGRTSNPQPYLKGDPLLEAEIADAPARANALVDAQYGFINALLRLYAPSFKIPVQLQGMTQTIVARNVSASGGNNTMTVAGQIEFANVTYKGTVLCEGEDLAIRQVTLAPPTVTCDTNDIVGRFQCQGQQAAMAGTSGALAAALTNIYQGQAFHYSTVDRPLQFTLGEAEFAAKFEALKSSSRDSTVSEDGRVTIERIDRAR
jgi:hypothetical protein